jgi:hypothetical protein
MQRGKTTITDITTVNLDSPEMVESILKIHSCNVGDGSFSPLHIMANFMLLLVQLIRVAQKIVEPRAVHQIYETAQGLEEKGWRYSMAGNFVEVYNENPAIEYRQPFSSRPCAVS